MQMREGEEGDLNGCSGVFGDRLGNRADSLSLSQCTLLCQSTAPSDGAGPEAERGAMMNIYVEPDSRGRV